MKIFTYICMVCLMAFIGAATTKAQTNLLSNPGFEEVDDDGYINIWTTNTQNTAYVTFTRVNTDKYSGDYSAQLEHLSGVGGAVLSQTVPVTAGQTYNYSFAYKVLSTWTTATSPYIRLTITSMETVESVIYNIPTSYTLNEWVNYSNTLTIPAGNTTAKISIKVFRFTALIDDVSISLVNTTTGVKDITGTDQTLSLGPNPVIDNTTTATFAEAGNNAIIRIVSLTGKTVLQQSVTKGSTQASIDVSNFAKGVYLVNYSDDKVKNKTVKLIK